MPQKEKTKTISMLEPKRREQNGCDICKKNPCATEGFIGFCQHQLYVCGDCVQKIINS